MKKIIIGQLMLWGNVITLIVGYYVVRYFPVSSYVEVMAALIGILSTIVNCIYAITIQESGYKEMGIEAFDKKEKKE